MRLPVAIFGFKDTLAGQVYQMLESAQKYDVRYFVSLDQEIGKKTRRDSNDFASARIEYVENNRLFGLEVVSVNSITRLLNDNIHDVFVLEDDTKYRSRIYDVIAHYGIRPLSFIHDSVTLSSNHVIEDGAIIFPNSYIGYKSHIGKGSILQAGCSIDHHTRVGDFCNLSPRVTIAGLATLGNFVELNMCVEIVNRIWIQERVRVGAGSLVLQDCLPNALYYGRPAKLIRYLDYSEVEAIKASSRLQY